MTYYYAGADDIYSIGRVHTAKDMDEARRGALRALREGYGYDNVIISRTGEESRMFLSLQAVGFVGTIAGRDRDTHFYSPWKKGAARYRINKDGSLGGRL